MALEFRATLKGVPDSSATFILIPNAIMKQFGGRIRVPVVVTIKGITHRTTICNMGMGPMVGIPVGVRKESAIKHGDRIAISMEPDQKERTVSLPPDFVKAMTDAERRAFGWMAYTHRKEYVQWIEDAKKPDTRVRRIESAREKLRQKGSSG
jgi:uncharacterized protein YdeI (YjbR/CyaY-like superfamily)